ncbi:MAG TPA: hypothetical protein VN033_03755 [Vulgatibacter sp.]|nr:hypothetical protein [Vulgatibacter sp.]
MKKLLLNKRELTLSMAIGFLLGLPIAGMVAGFVAWASLQRRAADLAGEFGLAQAVVVVAPIQAGNVVEARQLAKRPVPRMVTSANTVAPDEVDELLGTPSRIAFEPGDVLLRTAFDLPPRPPPERPAAAR